jgi:acetyl-CoA carboxylase biotin carboxyl carrier protein
MSDDHDSPATQDLVDVVRAFAESDLQELSVSSGGIDLFIARTAGGEMPAATRPVTPAAGRAREAGVPEPAPAVVDSQSEAPVAAPPAPGLTEVRSPAVGIFYRRPSPDKDPFVEVGTRVEVGDPVGTIEVMKMYTALPTPVAGVVVEVCVPDGSFVEHDQVVVYIDESA